MQRLAVWLFTIIVTAVGLHQSAAAQSQQPSPERRPLVADLSQHKIGITAGFAGTDLLLFGAKEGPGDIIVVVSGPDEEARVRKKERVSGLWINTESVLFNKVPGFYRVAATNNWSASDLDQVLRENGVGLRYLNLAPASAMEPGKAAKFREALLRRKEVQGLYSETTGQVDVLGDVLFRTRVSFPANVPTGTYQVDVYRVLDGWVVSSATIPLSIGKVGMEATVFWFAHEYPALYGIIAIVIAAAAGYGAGMMFGRR